MEYLKDKPGCFQCDPQAPDCKDAWLWHIRTKNEDSSEDERAISISVSGHARANTADAVVQNVVSRIGKVIQAGSTVKLPEKEESAPELTEEETRQLAESKEAKTIAAEEKKNAPTEKAKAWLAKFAQDQ